MPVAFEFKGSRSALRDHRAVEAIVQADAPDVGLQVGAVEQRLPWSGWGMHCSSPRYVTKIDVEIFGLMLQFG
jgi:hypothetical protein